MSSHPLQLGGHPVQLTLQRRRLCLKRPPPPRILLRVALRGAVMRIPNAGVMVSVNWQKRLCVCVSASVRARSRACERACTRT